tara:strand:+ start:611 stop:1036 length:426 start_codon:yes stop_codon:yes gene_type:complete
MTLIKWINNPSLMNEVNHWAESLSIHKPLNFYNKTNTWVPQFEVQKTSDSYQMFAELPGMNKKNVTIEFIGNILNVSGEKSKPISEKNYSEIVYGKFSRSFSLPKDIINSKVSAKMRDGILALYIPRKESIKPKSKKITIK